MLLKFSILFEIYIIALEFEKYKKTFFVNKKIIVEIKVANIFKKNLLKINNIN